MKKMLLAPLFVCIFSFAVAQDYAYADSLKRQVMIHPDIKLLLPLAYFYLEIDLDSSMKYAQQAYELALNKKSEDHEAWSLSLIGAILWRGGNTDQALRTLLQSLKMFERLDDSLGLSIAYLNLGALYAGQNDPGGALNYLFNSLRITPALDLPGGPVMIKPAFQRSLAYGLIGNIYINLNKLDSALYFTQKSYETYMNFEDKKYLPITLSLLGYIHQLSGNTNLALEFFRLSVKEAYANANLTQAANSYYNISGLFMKNNAKDSGFYYAKKAYELARQINNPYLVSASSQILKEHYRQEGKLDSAFKYQELLTTAKDSLLSLEKVKQVQNLSFQEQMRQQELRRQEILSKEKRKKNLQLLAIAVFIPAFFGLILFLSKKKVRPRTVEFLGLLALLLLFEFIALFIHPYIGAWTHEAPVWMLLILVCVAAVLVPTHHALEKWVKQKLAKSGVKKEFVMENSPTPMPAPENFSGPQKDPY